MHRIYVSVSKLRKIPQNKFDFFFISMIDSQSIAPGDLTERKQLRKKLKCQNFRWYLENVYPESTWLKEYTDMGEAS